MDTTRSAARATAHLAQGSGLLRQTRTYPERLAAPREAIFPLLCPTRELDWIPGWDCELLHTDTGYAEEGLVFRSRDAAGERVWYCDIYEPAGRIAYVNFLPDLLTRLVVTLDEAADGETLVVFSFTFLALTDAGNTVIRHLPAGESDPHGRLPGLIRTYLAG